MNALFATCLLVSLALALAVAFSSPKTRRWLKWLLFVSLVVAWIALGFALRDIVLRTKATLVTPGGARRPALLQPAAAQGLTLLLSLGGPALVVTALAWLAIRATRQKAS
jgi:hypothetical protein